MVDHLFQVMSPQCSRQRLANGVFPGRCTSWPALLASTLFVASLCTMIAELFADTPIRQLPVSQAVMHRLPRPIRLSHGRSPSSLRTLSVLSLSQSDDRDWLFFARESLEAPVPLGWHVREAAFGRDVRMVLTPVKVVGSRLPKNVIWVSCSVDPRLRKLQLSELLKNRIDAHLASARVNPPKTTMLNGKPAVSSTFFEERSDGAVEGGHLLVATDWAIYEIHWAYPIELAKSQRQLVQDWLGEIEFRRPREQKQQLAPAILAAADVVGSWKAYHSRIRFFPDGRVVIIRDPIRMIRVDVATPERMEKLVGSFRGHEDLLHVVWDDGSKLNFRWRVDGDRLLLTDHEGRVSQLRQLLE